MRIILCYSQHHAQLRKILDKKWHLLTIDLLISKFVGPRPKITFRSTKSIRDQLMSSHYLEKNYAKQINTDQRGTYSSGSSERCLWLYVNK